MLAHSTGHYAAGTNPALLRSNTLESINSSVYMNPDKFPDAQDPNWKPADSCSPTQKEDTPMKGGMALIPVPKSTLEKRLPPSPVPSLPTPVATPVATPRQPETETKRKRSPEKKDAMYWKSLGILLCAEHVRVASAFQDWTLVNCFL